MIENVPERIPRPALKGRRQEIEQRLAAFGLARGPRRLFRGESSAGFDEACSGRLRSTLEGLGPIFSAFGLYLSSRADLLQARDCLELATIPDRAAATPAATVRKLLDCDVNNSPAETFMAFEEEPFESRLLFQSHYARLANGDDVIVKIIHPEAEDRLSYDLELLPLFRHSLAGIGLSDSAFKSVVADFRHTLHQQTDFINELRALEALIEDAEDYDALRAPQVYRPLCTSKVLVSEKLNGLKLNSVLSSLGEYGRAIDSHQSLRSIGLEPKEAARLLCEVWLRQALLGRCFPVEPCPTNVMILPGKQIAFTGGVFAGLPAEPQANLWDYLIAAANENSDKACSHLLREMRREGASAKEDEVRQRFRQAIPFRDGGWDRGGDSQSLAELLFVQWRCASQYGYLPMMHLPGFFRGLFSVADVARRLAPQVDPLMEALRDVRLIAGLAEFRELVSRRRLADQMDRYAAMMTDMPQSLDEALSFASEGRARLKLQAADSPGHHGEGNSSAVVTALLLVLAAVALLSDYLTASAGGAWANRINTIVFMVFGALLLRAVSRAR